MRQFVRVIQLITLVVIVASVFVQSGYQPSTALDAGSVIGGNAWCSAAEGAALVLTIAGFANPGFAIAGALLGAGALYFC